MNDSPSPPTRRSTPRSLSGMQILFASILAIGLLLGINFSNRITAGQRIQSERESLEMEIATLQAEQATLQEELAYTRGDDYVADWARSEGKMVREGEVLVVPVPAGNVVSTPTPPPPPAPALFPDEDPLIEPWRVWWALFFDEEPPF